MSWLLALPFDGGDVRRIFNTPSENSFTSLREEWGVTFTFKKIFSPFIFL